MTIRPDHLINHPYQRGFIMFDPLADVLRSVRLTGGIFLNAHFTAPWCVTANVTAEDCRPFLADPVQLIGYHFVREGRLLVLFEGEAAIEVRAGEIVLFPRNDGHILASGKGLAAVSAGTLIQPPLESGLPDIRYGGDGERTVIVCGFLATQEGYNPLIAALPRQLVLNVGDGLSRDWIETSVRFAARELAEGRLASSSVMSRLSETLLVEAVRHYSSTLPDESMGWLRGLKDTQIGRALTLIHQNIGAPWTAERLAREVAMSRSAFVERFTALVGVPPIRYVTAWRLQTARLHLTEARQTIAQLARSVGYESEEAFSRAFKREFGMPPARWRGARATV